MSFQSFIQTTIGAKPKVMAGMFEPLVEMK